MNGTNVSIIAHALTVVRQAAIKELTRYGRVCIGVHLAALGSLEAPQVLRVNATSGLRLALRGQQLRYMHSLEKEDT